MTVIIVNNYNNYNKYNKYDKMHHINIINNNIIFEYYYVQNVF